MIPKGALYSAVYETDWVVFAGTTVYCVGYHIGDHMFWCPVYNRRDLGQEVDPNTPADLAAIFGTDSFRLFLGLNSLSPAVRPTQRSSPATDETPVIHQIMSLGLDLGQTATTETRLVILTAALLLLATNLPA
jgi:hypothetical protein